MIAILTMLSLLKRAADSVKAIRIQFLVRGGNDQTGRDEFSVRDTNEEQDGRQFRRDGLYRGNNESDAVECDFHRYSIQHLSVSRRLRELGIRIALGAQRQAILSTASCFARSK